MEFTGRSWRWSELMAFFFLAPLVYATKLVPVAPVIFFALYLVGVGRPLMLHNWKGERQSLSLSTLFLLAFVPTLALAALAILTGHFMWMPLEKSALFLRILVFYPVVSVIPQELIYRIAFFDRYQDLLPSKCAFTLLNALAFSILHSVYQNPYALGLTFLGGLLYASLRVRGVSFFELVLIHTIHGLALFSFGLGQFFYINLFASPVT